MLLIGFAIGTLGIHVAANGSLLLFRQAVEVLVEKQNISLPSEVSARWPRQLVGVEIGGLRVGSNVAAVGCNRTLDGGALSCEFRWN